MLCFKSKVANLQQRNICLRQQQTRFILLDWLFDWSYLAWQWNLWILAFKLAGLARTALIQNARKTMGCHKRTCIWWSKIARTPKIAGTMDNTAKRGGKMARETYIQTIIRWEHMLNAFQINQYTLSTFPSSNRRNFEDSGKVLAVSVCEFYQFSSINPHL